LSLGGLQLLQVHRTGHGQQDPNGQVCGAWGGTCEGWRVGTAAARAQGRFFLPEKWEVFFVCGTSENQLTALISGCCPKRSELFKCMSRLCLYWNLSTFFPELVYG